MRTKLRKIGKFTGMILPRSILREIGLKVGAAIDLRLEDGKLIGTPVATDARAGWADAAAAIGSEEPVKERLGAASPTRTTTT